MSNNVENNFTSFNKDDDRFKLLPFEQNLMVDNFISDVLYIMASGLALERLFFAHLHLYSDQMYTYLVINTTPEDEHFYLEKLKVLNPDSPPKLITADVLAKDRVIIYKSGGVQFVTSRILMVDLLAGRVPFDKVAGILVYRAHEFFHGFKESFILRLFREKKTNGFVKAFTDRPLYIISTGLIGQLQRLVNLLYVRKVVIVPRFHEEVKECFEKIKPKFTQITIKLEPLQRNAQSTLYDIIATCVRELKQCTKGFDLEELSDKLTPYAILYPTKFELELRKSDVCLTDRQKRLLDDLRTLRNLYQKLNLDPTNAMNFISWLRSDEETIKNNSGWLFTNTAATLFSSIDNLCSLNDNEGNKTIAVPAKWSVFCNLITEITEKLKAEYSDSPLLVLVSNEALSRQLIDLVKFGQKHYTWALTRRFMAPTRRDSLCMAPLIEPLWNPSNIVCYDEQIFEKDKQNLRTDLRFAQKEEAKKCRKRGKVVELPSEPLKQTRLDCFGIAPRAPKTSHKYGNGKDKRRSPSMNIKLPFSREVIPEGMLPEDPFTSFYEQMEERNKKYEESKQKEQTIDEIPKNDEDIIATTSSNYSPPLPSTPEDTKRLPIRRFINDEHLEKEDEWKINQLEPPLDRSIAVAARIRAENSIHIIDEFNKTKELQNLEEEKELQQNLTEKTYLTQKNSQKSMLVFLEVSSRYQLLNCLETLKPSYIIMYSQDMSATRIIETFKCLNEDHLLELYVLIYEDSYEEERYLSSIQKENEAIETLIKEQSLLMIPREFDVSRDNTSQLRRLSTLKQRRDTRNQKTCSSKESQIFFCDDNEMEDEEQKENRQKIIVDLREFNSELPTVLYRRGLDLMAAMLEVGDYILSPDICCERKSPDDLTQSLLSGRIFKQVEQGEMSRYSRNVRSLFAILIRDNPNLHVLWSLSPSHSAELFEELKLDQPEPVLEIALKKKRDCITNNDGIVGK
ncbi:ERCC4 domain-containing protein [Meloidogyne graminicola]|uniref:ERCC4 domain-containing protein n=1 Tax=Meloidogyne graminicola TaxID=189291 RepID=A0A8S9ZGV1_9BILA|nr:ERCC4 domain-containing protein [Meloidogyne graminicola]